MADSDGFTTAGAPKPEELKKFRMVRSIFGQGRDVQEAKDKYNFIPSGGMNDVIKAWHEKQPERDISGATPSGLTKCPRAVWLENHNVPHTSDMTWAVKQRLLLGRNFENMFAEQLNDAGMLLFHWKDDPGVVVDRFETGEGINHMSGVPDYLLKLQDGLVVVSDAKTARSDSFGYVPIHDAEVWTNWGYYKYRIQLTAYYMLCHANEDWFIKQGLTLPQACHMFVFALDDGVVRRELTWTPSTADTLRVESYVNRYNLALTAETPPACTCLETFDQFEMKFCQFGVKEKPSDKVNSSCCSDNLIPAN